MSIWYILLVTVMADGKLMADVRYPNNPQYNNEQTCNEVGEFLMKEEQGKIGTNSGVVYYICKEITAEEQRKATKGNNT
jgi:hypothetical protein